jgi:hypothetical protein
MSPLRAKSGLTAPSTANGTTDNSASADGREQTTQPSGAGPNNRRYEIKQDKNVQILLSHNNNSEMPQLSRNMVISPQAFPLSMA